MCFYRVSTQRVQCKRLKEGKKSHLTQSRIDKLEELGFVWSLHEIQAQQQNLDAATIAAISAAGAVASANVAEVGQDITNFAAIDLTNAGLEDIAGDEEATKELNIMVQVFLSVLVQ